LAELIVKRLDLGPAHLIGHSYGALTAVYMAYQHSELVRTLVLGEPPVMSLLENNHRYIEVVYPIVAIANDDPLAILFGNIVVQNIRKVGIFHFLSSNHIIL